jgi:hypothetical protein
MTNFIKALAIGATVAILAACAGSQAQLNPSESSQQGSAQSGSKVSLPNNKRVHRATASRYIYVSDRTEGALLVYPAGQQNPSPIRTITTGLHTVEGIAVDPSGDVYVANANSNGIVANVLEYSSGGTSLVQTFTQGLHYPVNVAIGPSGVVYVADQLSEAGKDAAIVEYPSTGGAPIRTLQPPGYANDDPRGVAVDPAGDVFVTLVRLPDNWPPGAFDCTDINLTYEYQVSTSTWIQLHPNPFAWGLALDSALNLYASDPGITGSCAQVITRYSPPDYLNSSAFVLPYTFNSPVYETISSDQLLAVPSASSTGNTGYVTVINLNSGTLPITITNGLKGPIGAARGP